MQELAGRCALVTGAARGMGYGIADALAAAGVQVALADVRLQAAEEAAASLSARYGVRCLAFALDVADLAAFRQVAHNAAAALGPVKILVNNAGFGVLGSDLDALSDETARQMVEVNFGGVLNGVRAVLPGMRQSGGHIVNVASIGGLHVMPGWRYALYAATKAAVVSLSEGMRDDLSDTGVGVSVLCPGGVRTGFYDDQPASAGRDGGQANRDAVADGMDPRMVGRFVVDAIREDRFMIITHPELWPFVERRFERWRGAFREGEAVAAQLGAAPAGDAAARIAPKAHIK